MRGPHVRPGNSAERAALAAAALMEASLSADLQSADMRLLAQLTNARVGDLRHYVERVRRLLRDFALREGSTQGYWFSPRSRATASERLLLDATRSGAFVLMCSGDGFKRQRALEAVREVPSGFCLGLLIVRLNDWVEEVRQAARLALDGLAERLKSDLLLECYELYLSSSDWGRMRKVDRVALDRLFGQGVPRDLLMTSIVARRDDRAVTTAERMLRRGEWDSELPTLATTACHWGVRLKALRALFAGEHRWLEHGMRRRPLSTEIDREFLIDQALGDRSASVRLAGLRAYAESLEVRPHARSRLEGLVLDGSAKVASSAAFWLGHAGGDPRTVIREQMGSGAPLAAATLGLLGTVGKPGDDDALLQAANTSVGWTKWTALTAAARLAPGTALPLIEAIALGEHTGEARRAVRTLARLDQGIEFGRLMQWAATPEEFVARNFFVLAHKQVPWRASAIVLNLALHGAPIESLGPHLELILRRSARSWLPNAQERLQLRSMLDRLPVDRLPELLRLRWVLDRSS